MSDFPGVIVSASSDGTCMVFEIPDERDLSRPVYPSATLYHPSYCYAIRAHPNFFQKEFYVAVGGHDFGLKTWKIEREQRKVVSRKTSKASLKEEDSKKKSNKS